MTDERTVLWTLKETADYLRKSPAQLRWMRHKGTGPRSAKIGGRVMYRQPDVLAWVNAVFEPTAPTERPGAIQRPAGNGGDAA